MSARGGVQVPNALLRHVVLVVAVVVLDAVQEPVPAVGARGRDDAVVVRFSSMKRGLDEVADGEALRRGSRQWLSRRGDGLRPHVLWLRRRQRRSRRRRRGRSGGLGGRRRARGLDEAVERASCLATVQLDITHKNIKISLQRPTSAHHRRGRTGHESRSPRIGAHLVPSAHV